MVISDHVITAEKSIELDCVKAIGGGLGLDRVRFCGHCKLNVYNLGEMEREEAEAFAVFEGRRRRRAARVQAMSRLNGYIYHARPPLSWLLVTVVLYLFLLGLNAFSPGEAPVATAIVLALAVLWLAHAWRRILAGGFVSRPDRERRGF